MTTNKDHLDIDLDFLDKKDAPQPTASKQTSGPSQNTSPASPARKYNWKNIIIVGGIILFVGWLIVAGSSDSSTSSSSSNSTYTPSSNSTYTPTTNTNTNLVGATGQTFSCSSYNYDRATALQPNSYTVSTLSSESASLDSRTASLKTQKAQIDAMYVDQSDQSSLDAYNAAVDDFNLKNDQLKIDIASWNQRNQALNTQINTYNNFLDTNCTPQ